MGHRSHQRTIYTLSYTGFPLKNKFILPYIFVLQFGQFASDLGGVVGLWVGASVLTCFEYAEYVLDLLVLWFRKSGSNTTTQVKSVNSAAMNPSCEKQDMNLEDCDNRFAEKETTA